MSNIFEYKIVETGLELCLLKNKQKCSLEQWNGFSDISQLELISIIENKILENDPNISKLETYQALNQILLTASHQIRKKQNKKHCGQKQHCYC